MRAALGRFDERPRELDGVLHVDVERRFPAEVDGEEHATARFNPTHAAQTVPPAVHRASSPGRVIANQFGARDARKRPRALRGGPRRASTALCNPRRFRRVSEERLDNLVTSLMRLLLSVAAAVLTSCSSTSSTTNTPASDAANDARFDAGKECANDGDGPCCPSGRPTPEGCLIGQLEWMCPSDAPKTRALLAKRGCMNDGSVVFMCCPL